jgi:hypothetical protein
MDSLLQRTRPIRVRGPTVTLDVKAQPDGASTPWLPAESLQLADTWTPDLAQVRVGEPVTRAIAITAQGLSAAQLPDLVPDVPDGVKLYPDKPRNETRAEGDDLVAIKELKYALVPSVAGELTLPEMRLAWWDTAADRERVAILPARVLQVLPAGAGAETIPPPPTPRPASAAADSAATVDADSLPLSALIPESGQGPQASSEVAGGWMRGFPVPAGYWPWLVGIFGLLWLITLLLWLRERRLGAGALDAERKTRERSPAPSLSAARSLVHHACEANDPRSARDALLYWAAACWPESTPTRIEVLAARMEDPAADVLRALDRSLYAPAAEAWHGRAAWAVLSPALLQAERDRPPLAGEPVPLPPLYPQRA